MRHNIENRSAISCDGHHLASLDFARKFGEAVLRIFDGYDNCHRRNVATGSYRLNQFHQAGA